MNSHDALAEAREALDVLLDAIQPPRMKTARAWVTVNKALDALAARRAGSGDSEPRDGAVCGCGWPHVDCAEVEEDVGECVRYRAALAAAPSVSPHDETLREAVENWIEDADEVKALAESEDWRLHEIEAKLGAVYLGYGGGHNHDDDLRAALASARSGGTTETPRA